MKKNFLVIVMSLLLVLGLGAPASAGWVTDTCGDELGAGPDIEKAKVEVFSPGIDPDYEPWIYLCVDMCEGSGLPGMLIWEFNADNDVGTGPGSMLVMPFEPCSSQPGGKCKDYPDGIDLVIQKWTREQADDSTTAWCKSCSGLGQKTCATAGSPGETCIEGTCLPIDQYCAAAGNPSCKELEEGCTGGGNCEDLYDFDNYEDCAEGPCGRGARRGDYQVLINDVNGVQLVGGKIVDWGRTVPAKETGDPGECEKLPWGQILTAAKAGGAEFDLSTALSVAPDFIVSAWHDPTFGDDADDFFEDYLQPTMSVHANDWLPNGTAIAASESTTGGVCGYYENKFECCLDTMAEGKTVDMGACFPIGDETACNAAGCKWNSVQSRCTIDMCMGNLHPFASPIDNDMDGLDALRFKWDFGRQDCDCAP